MTEGMATPAPGGPNRTWLQRTIERWNARAPFTANPLNVAACRIAVSAALLISELFRFDYELLIRSSRALAYAPIGIMMVLAPHAPPSLAFVNTVRVIAIISTVLTLVGLFTRPMLAVSFVSSWILASTMYGFNGGGWSHEYNCILLVQLVLLFAPTDRALSLDALRRRKNGTPLARPSVLACNAPAFAAQFMVAWMFFNAFTYKTLVSGSAWWTSDNLRNILSFQWLASGMPTPAYVLFIADHAALFHSFAVASMLAQGCMLLTLIFFRWPYRRALLGLGFVAEALGLGFMMSRWDISPFNPHWLVLYAVFIDWNYFAGQRAADANAETPSETTARSSGKLVAAWAGSLVLIEFVASLATLGRLVSWAYPFTPYPMYSRVYGKVLLPKHDSFLFIGPRFASQDVNLSVGSPVARKVYSGNFYAPETSDWPDIKGRLIRAQTVLAARGGSVPSLSMFETIYTVRPYPNPAHSAPLLEGLRGAIDHRGEAYGVSAVARRLDDGSVALDFCGQVPDSMQHASVLAIPIDYRGIRTVGGVHSKSIYGVGSPLQLRGAWTDSTFTTRDLGPGAYLVALKTRSGAGVPSTTADSAGALFFTGRILEL